jgi:hypothetical protein
MAMKEFGSVLNCMDGRIQRKTSDYLTATFGVRFIDTLTAPGMVQHIASQTKRTDQILQDLSISIQTHSSRHIGIVAHADCAGNSVADTQQKLQIAAAMARLSDTFPDTQVVGLWISDRWLVERIR